MDPLFPDLIDDAPCLALMLHTTRQMVLKSAPNIRGRKALNVLDLALLNAIDDLEQVGVPTQVIPDESSLVSELPSGNRNERLQAVLRELEQNEDARLERPDIAYLKWLVSIGTKKPKPRTQDSQALRPSADTKQELFE